MRVRYAILLFALVNAALFSALQPLWEGFDEPFHYGYVETLWQTGRLPVLGRTMLPADVFASFPLAPMSNSVHVYIPEATIYSDWFTLPLAEKERRRALIDRLRPRPETSNRPNYEAHQTPLPYLMLAPVDWTLASLPMPVRVLTLRLIAALSTVLLLFYGTNSLCRTLQVPEPFSLVVLFTVFCSEMLYATTAHVANDWLAVAIGAPFLASLATFVEKADRRSCLRMSAWLAAGLLAKGYFLAFALLAAGVAAGMIWRRRVQVSSVIPGALLTLVLAGPWYVRNVALYGNVSGTHEEFDGIGVRQALAAAPHIDWLAAAGFLARGSLWMGNNSFGTFSRGTLHLMLALVALGFAAWCGHRRAVRPAEWAVFAGIAVFSIGVAYACCAAFADRHGTVVAAPPWYTQVLLAPVMALVYLGMSRWQRVGAILASVSLVLWTWVLVSSWTLKLFPLYSGGGSAPMRARDAWAWYTQGAAAHASDLSLTAMAPAPWLYTGMALSVALGVMLSAVLVRALLRINSRASYPLR